MKKIKKALVVDDSKLARVTLSRLLTNKGITVIEAESVVGAMDILSTDTVDAIFLDVQMPELNGFEGLKLIKANESLKNIPCSMYSGDLSTEAQQEAISRGAQAYLFKPANSESLEHVLEALEANIVAEDMRQYVPQPTVAESRQNEQEAQEGSQDSQSPAWQQQVPFIDPQQMDKHKKALLTLDGRTRSLARLLNQEKKETETAFVDLGNRLSTVDTELESLKKYKEHTQHDDLLHKRTENDIRGQLQKTRDNLRLATTVAIISVILAVAAIVIVGILYFGSI